MKVCDVCKKEAFKKISLYIERYSIETIKEDQTTYGYDLCDRCFDNVSGMVFILGLSVLVKEQSK